MISINNSGLQNRDFGVFGSMLHGFHHPNTQTLTWLFTAKKKTPHAENTPSLYAENHQVSVTSSNLKKPWREKIGDSKTSRLKISFGIRRRKQIYGLYDDRASGRTIKAEFEPVKAWSEIKSEYNPQTCITKKGWVKLKARIRSDDEAPFIPSIYVIDPLEFKRLKRGFEVTRIFSFMEEFRQQAQKDEEVIVEGNLEEVVSPDRKFHQVTLTYCPATTSRP